MTVCGGNIDAFGIVEGHRVITDSDHLHSRLDGESPGDHRTNISESLDNRLALIRRDFQMIERAINKEYDAAAGRLTAASDSA